MHTVLTEMLSHVLIDWDFIKSPLDGIHVILGHTPYPSGSYGVFCSCIQFLLRL